MLLFNLCASNSVLLVAMSFVESSHDNVKYGRARHFSVKKMTLTEYYLSVELKCVDKVHIFLSCVHWMIKPALHHSHIYS